MTEPETLEYLGFKPGTKIRREIIDGMASVKVPVTDADHIAAFRAFLKCAGKPATVAGGMT